VNPELAYIIGILINLVVLLIFARAVGSFFVRDWSRGIPRILWDVTEPILSPVRRLIPPMGGMDFSPVILIIGLQLLSGFITRL
jgi:YggT family protein